MVPTSSPALESLGLRYRALIGTGGIGSGNFFALDGNHTLGREESRSGHFLDRRDYCKLHIVSHYVCRLLGGSFSVIPLGMVGADDVGNGCSPRWRRSGSNCATLAGPKGGARSTPCA